MNPTEDTLVALAQFDLVVAAVAQATGQPPEKITVTRDLARGLHGALQVLGIDASLAEFWLAIERGEAVFQGVKLVAGWVPPTPLTFH